MDLEHQVTELTNRVAALEAIVSQVAAQQTPAPPVHPAVAPGLDFPPPSPSDRVLVQSYPPPAPGSIPAYPAQYPAVQPHLQPAAAVRRPPAFEWGIETLLRWAGVVLVALAAIFLVSTAISRGWIGPELQLLGAAIGGATMLAGAMRYADSRRPWSLALGCGGAAVLAVSAIATHEWLDIVGPGPALVLLVVATAASIAVALQLRLEGVALTASVFAMVGPLDALGDLGNAQTLIWISALIVGSSALGHYKSWAGERLITGWLGALLLFVFAVNEDIDGGLRTPGFLGIAVIGITLWAGPTIAKQLSPNGSEPWGSLNWAAVDYRMVALVPAWVWAISSGLLDFDEDRTFGLAAIAVAVGFLLLAEVTFAKVERLVSIATFFGAFSLLALGLALYLDGPALMVALAGQAATSYYLARRLNDNPLRVAAYVTGALASVLALLEMVDAIDDDGFATAGAALATAFIVACWIVAAVISYVRDDVEVPFDLNFLAAWIGTMVWLAALLLALPQGLVMISVAWAAMACAGLVLGLTRRLILVKNTALATLVLTLGKLVTIDMAEVDVFWRVGLFFVVGMGLIALGLKIPSLMAPPPPTSTGSIDPGTDPTAAPVQPDDPGQGPPSTTLTTF